MPGMTMVLRPEERSVTIPPVAAAATLLQAHALDESILIRAARVGERRFAATDLSGLAKVPQDVVDQAVATRCAKSLGGLCRRATLSETAAEALTALFAPAPPSAEATVAPALVGEGELRWRIEALVRAAAQ